MLKSKVIMQLFTWIFTFFYTMYLSWYPTPTITEGVVGQPETFFPHEASTEIDKTISSLIHRSLFRYDDFGSLTSDLAESYEISENGLIYTIKLKENQYWSDGTEITSDDLIYTSFTIPTLRDVITDRIDEYTVRFELPNRFSPFLSVLTTGIIQRNSIEQDSPLNPISSSDFRIVNINRDGDFIKEVILHTSNEEASFKRLVFRFYPNKFDLETAAKLGEVDAFLKTDNEQLFLDNFEEFQFSQHNVYFGLFFNLRNEKLQDLELRQNMRASLDLDNLILTYGIQAQGPISRNFYTSGSLDFDYYEEDLDYNAEELQLTLTVPDVKQSVELAENIKKVWQDRLNLDITINVVSLSLIEEKVINPREFEILFFGKEVAQDPDRYVSWHSTQKELPGLNITGFEQVRSDRALEEGRNIASIEERTVHYTEFQKVIDEDVPAIFLYHPYSRYYMASKISDFNIESVFSLSDRFLNFNRWTY
jgi:peptide/nickel transport system substrate-binding protein